MRPAHDSHEHDAERQATIAQVAALSRRLRELSAQGRSAESDERAVFLADKAALLARITDGASVADDVSGRELHVHNALSNQIVSSPGRADAAEPAAFAVEEGWRAAVTDDPYAMAGPAEVGDPMPGETAGPYVGVEMTDWMREHAAHVEAAIAAGPAPPTRLDDPAELAARIAALRAQVACAGTPATADHDTAADQASADGAEDAGWSR